MTLLWFILNTTNHQKRLENLYDRFNSALFPIIYLILYITLIIKRRHIKIIDKYYYERVYLKIIFLSNNDSINIKMTQ